MQPDLLSTFLTLAKESEDLYTASHVPRISKPTPLEFYRDFVAQNRPVIVVDAFDHWKAFSKWTNKYLKEKLGENIVTVDITPNGYGDAVVDDKYFVKPEEKQMQFGKFIDIIEHNKAHPENKSKNIYYVQHQNGNFQSEFSELFEDIDTEVDWVTEAMGIPPDVVNFWMGEDRSVSSMHKDHYENMYIVVAGEKQFTLLPPVDAPFLYISEFIAATYKHTEDGFIIQEDDPPSKIPVDPDKPDFDKYPLFKHAHPIHVVLKPGEMLYLPSMYYHKVTQKGDSQGRQNDCCELLYGECDRSTDRLGYDMQYGANWCYFKFLESVIEQYKRITISNNNNTDLKE